MDTLSREQLKALVGRANGLCVSIFMSTTETHQNAIRFDNLPELATVTLLAAQTDFSEPGEIGVFIDDDQIESLHESMARTGFLSGQQMGSSFKFLNSRDLIWSRNTRRYLLGQAEVGNDMMSWNADTTRMPVNCAVANQAAAASTARTTSGDGSSRSISSRVIPTDSAPLRVASS